MDLSRRRNNLPTPPYLALTEAVSVPLRFALTPLGPVVILGILDHKITVVATPGLVPAPYRHGLIDRAAKGSFKPWLPARITRSVEGTTWISEVTVGLSSPEVIQLRRAEHQKCRGGKELQS